jgi:hypothetical protein
MFVWKVMRLMVNKYGHSLKALNQMISIIAPIFWQGLFLFLYWTCYDIHLWPSQHFALFSTKPIVRNSTTFMWPTIFHVLRFLTSHYHFFLWIILMILRLSYIFPFGFFSFFTILFPKKWVILPNVFVPFSMIILADFIASHLQH